MFQCSFFSNLDSLSVFNNPDDCCNAPTAECLSCQDGLDIETFCERNPFNGERHKKIKF